MAIWNITECSQEELAGFELSWLPARLPPQIRSFRRNGRVGLEIDTIVGSVPLRNGDTLQIKPKIGAANFLRMLLESEISTTPSDSDADLVSYSTDNESSLASLVARPFVDALKTVAASSFRFGWKRDVRQSDSPTGDLVLLQTAIGLRSRSEKPFTYVDKMRTYDIPENRVLTAAAVVVSKRFSSRLSRDLRSFLRQFITRVAATTASARDIEHVKTRLAASSYSGARGYYIAPLRLALIILAQEGFSQSASDDLKAEPILFNSADVFEKFVRLAITDHYQKVGLTVRKSFFPPLTLFKDGSGSLQPDIVILRDERVRLIADVKYKADGTTSADLYQAHAYAQRAGVDFMIFFCATAASELQVTRRSSYLSLTVFEIFLPVSDLSRTRKHLQTIERAVPAFLPY